MTRIGFGFRFVAALIDGIALAIIYGVCYTIFKPHITVTADTTFDDVLRQAVNAARWIILINTAVVVASEAHPLVAIELAECLATADVPPGVVNIITGLRRELGPALASHMDVLALDLTGADGDLAELERLGAENVKRIVRGRADSQSPYDIAAFLELKTVWHPIGM